MGKSKFDKLGGGAKCHRCQKTVYVAEAVNVAKAAYHKDCLTCAKCHNQMDRGKVQEHKGEIYCQTCYEKYFGTKANTMITESDTNVEDDDAPAAVSSQPEKKQDEEDEE